MTVTPSKDLDEGVMKFRWENAKGTFGGEVDQWNITAAGTGDTEVNCLDNVYEAYSSQEKFVRCEFPCK